MNTRRRCRRISPILFLRPTFFSVLHLLNANDGIKHFNNEKYFPQNFSLFPSLDVAFFLQKAKFCLKRYKNKVLPFVGEMANERENLLKCPKSYEKKLSVALRIDLHCHGVVWEAHRVCFSFELICSLAFIHLTSSALFKLLSFGSPEMISRISSLRVTRDLHNLRKAIKFRPDYKKREWFLFQIFTKSFTSTNLLNFCGNFYEFIIWKFVAI